MDADLRKPDCCDFFCTHCGHALSAPAGSLVECPSCRTTNRTPRRVEEPSAALGSEREAIVKFFCTHCQQKLSSPAGFAGRSFDCPNCSRESVVPGTPKAASAPGDEEKLHKFFCTSCGQKLSCESALANKTIDCPVCLDPTVVPPLLEPGPPPPRVAKPPRPLPRTPPAPSAGVTAPPATEAVPPAETPTPPPPSAKLRSGRSQRSLSPASLRSPVRLPAPQPPSSARKETAEQLLLLHDRPAGDEGLGRRSGTREPEQLLLLDDADVRADQELQRRIVHEARAQALREFRERSQRDDWDLPPSISASTPSDQELEREAKQKAEREAKEKAAREEKEKAEREAKEKAAREARAKAEREAEEKATREARERSKREAKARAEQRARARTERKSGPRKDSSDSGSAAHASARNPAGKNQPTSAASGRAKATAQTGKPDATTAGEPTKAARPDHRPLPPVKKRISIPAGKSQPATPKNNQPVKNTPIQQSGREPTVQATMPDELPDTQPIRLTHPLSGRSKTILPKPRGLAITEANRPRPIRLDLDSPGAGGHPVPPAQLPRPAKRELSAKVSKLMAQPNRTVGEDQEDDPFAALLDEDFDLDHLLPASKTASAQGEPRTNQNTKPAP